MGTKTSTEWTVYILQTQSGKFYTGITTSLERRFHEHQKKKKGARFFHFSKPTAIVFKQTYPDRSQASKRESEIKKLSRKEKIELIDLYRKKTLN